MKTKILKTLMFISKYAFYVFLIQLISIQLLVANDISSQSLKDVKISLEVDRKTPVQIFKLIERKTDFKFGYNRSVARINKEISGSFTEGSLEEVLTYVAKKAQLKFKRINYNIAVSVDQQQANPVYIEEPEISISGTVKDSESGEPLVGATVRVKGTQIGVITDANGQFSLLIPDDATLLVVSYIGFLTNEVSINNQSAFEIALQPGTQSLDEVVVIGYGSQKKSDYTGSVESVPEQRLQKVPNLNVAQAIQGSVPGVNITQNQAGAASEESIIIRGRNSILANNSPLIVVDRIPYYGELRDINVNDIESIEVLKDASATAIYGSRGSNGVILITTKKGTKGEPVVTYDGRYSIQRYDELPNYMDAMAFYAFKEIREPGNVTATEQENYDQGNFVNWQDLGTRNGHSWQHNLSIAGSTQRLNYYLGGNYLDVKGIAINDDYKRATGRLNLDVHITDWLSVGSRTQYSDDDRSGLSPYFSDLGRKNPLINPYGQNGELAIYPWPEFTDINNPLEPINYDNTDEARQLITNNYLLLELPFVKGLSYRLNTGLTERFENYSTYRDRNTKAGIEAGGVADVETVRFTSSVVENILDYSRAFDKHMIGATGVYSYQKDKTTMDQLHAEGFPNDITSYYNTTQAQVIEPFFQYVKTDLISAMLRLNYGYNEKYFITLTGRRDGYSGFGDNNKWGSFGTVAGAWILSEENFFPTQNAIGFLKIRASYGGNGNQAVDPYLSIAKFRSGNYVDGSTSKPGVIPDNLANPELSWETSRSFNFGLDFGLLNNSVSGSINYFNTSTEDLLLNRTISPVHGIGSITDNIGETENKGLELSLSTTQEIAGTVIWNANFNFSVVENEIVSLGLGENGEVDDVASGLFIGEPITANYDFLYDGVWQENEADLAAEYDTQPGYIKIRDVNGDGEITADDRTIIGQTDPKQLWGFTNTFTYKNLSLTVFVHGVHGVTKENELFQDASASSGVRRNVILKNWWAPDNPTNEFYANDIYANSQQGFGAPLYQDAGFVRFKDITLSYSLPEAILSKVGLGRATFYFSGRNLITITDWDESDPELNAGRGTTPLQKEYVFGITLTN